MQIERRLVTLLSVGLLALGAAVAQEARERKDDEKKDDAPKTAKIGETAPDFTLTDCHGKEWKLSEHKDKVVVLEWTNQDCPWVIRSLPYLKELAKKYEDKAVVWVPIDSTKGRKAEDNVKFIKDKELPHSGILMDSEQKVGRLYGARTTPHIFVIAKGKLVYSGALHDDQNQTKEPGEVRHYTEDAIKAALDDKDVAIAEARPWGCVIRY